jgi:hypothetical protein
MHPIYTRQLNTQANKNQSTQFQHFRNKREKIYNNQQLYIINIKYIKLNAMTALWKLVKILRSHKFQNSHIHIYLCLYHISQFGVKIKNKLSYTSISPICFYGIHWDRLYSVQCSIILISNGSYVFDATV